jgi:hypothetical protein
MSLEPSVDFEGETGRRQVGYRLGHLHQGLALFREHDSQKKPAVRLLAKRSNDLHTVGNVPRLFRAVFQWVHGKF